MAGCGSESKESTENSKAVSNEPLTESEFKKMLSDPMKYEGAKVEFFGTVFVEPEKDEDGTYLQIFDKNDNNIIVAIEDPDLEVELDDIVKVKGTVVDEFKGENAFGGTITAPSIKAESVEVTDYATAFAPAIKTIEVNQEQTQHGYVFDLAKVEIAEDETRAYIKITNNSKEEISFYSFNSKITAGTKQLEEDDDYNYPEIPSEILPGVSVEGIVVFPTIKDEQGTAKFYFEGSSENYDIDIEPFIFDVNLEG